MLRQQKFLTNFLENIKSDPDNILRTINNLRSLITKPENMVLYLAANIHHLDENPAEALADFLPNNITPLRKRYSCDSRIKKKTIIFYF